MYLCNIRTQTNTGLIITQVVHVFSDHQILGSSASQKLTLQNSLMFAIYILIFFFSFVNFSTPQMTLSEHNVIILNVHRKFEVIFTESLGDMLDPSFND